MTDNKKDKRRKLMKLVFFKIPIFIMIFCAIMIGALKLVERHPEPLRQGFEEYLSKSTQRNATIGKLTKVTFFPNFIIHAENITAHSRKNAANIDLKIDDIKINAPFLTAFFGGTKLNELSVKNMVAVEGMFGPMPVTVDAAEIITRNDDEKVGSFFVASGKYNGKKASLESALEAGTYSYKVPNYMPFSIKVGAYDVSATLKRKLTSVILEGVVLSHGEKQTIAKEYLLSKDRKTHTDNPIFCLLLEDDLKNCDTYFDETTQVK